MANKGLWSIVQYPKSTDLEKLLSVLRGSGAAIMWILHDKDLKEDGTPKPPHYHIAAGWSKGFPDWAKVLDMIAEGTYNPPRIIDGQVQKPFKPKVQDCYPKGTPEEIRIYFLHWDDESKRLGKFQYSENDLHTDEKWNPADYTKSEDKRRSKSAEKAAEKADAFKNALCIAKENNIGEWSDLCDYYMEHGLDLGALVACAYPVKSYLDSARNVKKTSALCVQELERHVESLESELEQYRSGAQPAIEKLTVRNNRLNNQVLQLESELECETKASTRAMNWILKLYADYTGEYVAFVDIMAEIYNFDKRPDLG